MNPIRVLRAIRAFVRIAADPTRLEEVFALADLAEESPEIQRLLREIRVDPEIAPVFDDKPRLGKIDLDALIRLPEGTLGREYAEFMRRNGLKPEDLVLVEGQSDFHFLRNHMRETHDLWHVATGFDTDVAGELGVQAFYVAQFRAPLGVALLSIGLLNTVLKAMDDRDHRMRAIVRGWLLGKQARGLFGYRWADNWSKPLSEVRKGFRIDLDAIERSLPREADERVFARAA